MPPFRLPHGFAGARAPFVLDHLERRLAEDLGEVDAVGERERPLDQRNAVALHLQHMVPFIVARREEEEGPAHCAALVASVARAELVEELAKAVDLVLEEGRIAAPRIF